jgi:hypothetical protein
MQFGRFNFSYRFIRDSMSRMTICLLNWKRPENVFRIIQDLRSQDAKPSIFLWDNSLNDHHQVFEADWIVKSSENKRCWPRWWMASMAQTEYVMSLDDDLTVNDSTFISDLIAQLDTSGDRIIGVEGVVLLPGKSYQESKQIKISEKTIENETIEVDIVKGRLLSFRHSLLKNIQLGAMQSTEDDIAISGMIGKGKIKHWVIPNLAKRTINLPDAHATWKQDGHFQRRDAALKEFFPKFLEVIKELNE